MRSRLRRASGWPSLGLPVLLTLLTLAGAGQAIPPPPELLAERSLPGLWLDDKGRRLWFDAEGMVRLTYVDPAQPDTICAGLVVGRLGGLWNLKSHTQDYSPVSLHLDLIGSEDVLCAGAGRETRPAFRRVDGAVRLTTPPQLEILGATWAHSDTSVAFAKLQQGHYPQTDYWVILPDGAGAKGPLDRTGLNELARTGLAGPETWVWSSGRDWTGLRRIADMPDPPGAGPDRATPLNKPPRTRMEARERLVGIWRFEAEGGNTVLGTMAFYPDGTLTEFLVSASNRQPVRRARGAWQVEEIEPDGTIRVTTETAADLLLPPDRPRPPPGGVGWSEIGSKTTLRRLRFVSTGEFVQQDGARLARLCDPAYSTRPPDISVTPPCALPGGAAKPPPLPLSE